MVPELMSQHPLRQTLQPFGLSDKGAHPTTVPLVKTAERPPLPDWIFLAIGLGLLLISVLFDAYRPFNRQFSNLYFLIALYSAAFLRGRTEIGLYSAIVVSMFAVPYFTRPDMSLFNRVMGIFIALAVVTVIRDRRRLIQCLQVANSDLESKVVARTAELSASQQSLEELSRKLLTTQETERTHLSHELHDEIGQVLTAIKMNLSRLQREPETQSSSIIEENFEMIDNAINQVRNLAIQLHPPHLKYFGLIATLEWFLKKQAAIAGFKEKISATPADLKVPPELALVCFRIAQEAVTNAVRHAAASQIEIEIRQENSELHLIIRDDGKGFDMLNVANANAETPRVGLYGMRERVSLVNGNFDVDTRPGHGTTIHARFPYSI